MSQFTVTITGYIASEPVLTQYPKAPKLTMRVASSRRYAVPAQGEGDAVSWQETDQLFIDVEAWGDLAEHMKTSLVRGMPVIVVGSLNSSSFEAKEGGRRSRTYVRAAHVGLDLNRYVVASRKMDGAVVPDGMEAPTGEPPVPDVDRTQDSKEDTVADSQAACGGADGSASELKAASVGVARGLSAGQSREGNPPF